MSNYHAPRFYRIDFIVIPSYIELPWYIFIILHCPRFSSSKYDSDHGDIISPCSDRGSQEEELLKCFFEKLFKIQAYRLHRLYSLHFS